MWRSKQGARSRLCQGEASRAHARDDDRDIFVRSELKQRVFGARVLTARWQVAPETLKGNHLQMTDMFKRRAASRDPVLPSDARQGQRAR
jgi:hypothetical protein